MTAVEEPFEIDPSAPVLLEPVPPDETFWRKHSPQLEMPTSFLIATFLMTAMFGVLVLFMLYALGPGPEKMMPTMGLVDGGEDDAGIGSPGAAGGGLNDLENQAKTTTAETPPEIATVPDQSLPAVQDIKNSINIDDPTAPAPAIAPSKVDAYGALDEAIRKQMLAGAAGPTGTGKPNAEGVGTGPGGVGADKTRARSLRWTMLFKTQSGRDYLDQLHALGAVVLVGVPPDRKEMYIFRDLKNPRPGTIATPADFAQFASQVQFNDAKSDAVRSVGQELRLDFAPDSFWAIFPKGIEEELARLEGAYQNRRAEDIEQTRFQVSVVGGRHKLVVADQRLRRK